MIILHKLYEFNIPVEEMITIYILFIRSILEYSCVIWHSSITVEECVSLERVQKTALRIILKNDYHDYFTALKLTHLQTLKERRKCLSLTFAKKCLKSEKSADMFPRNMKNEKLWPKERLNQFKKLLKEILHQKESFLP